MKNATYLLALIFLWMLPARAEFEALKVIPKKYKCFDQNRKDSKVLKSCDAVSVEGGFCNLPVAACLMQADNCRMNQLKNCNSPEQRFSLLYLARFNQLVASDNDRKNLSKYNKIKLGTPGTVSLVLANFAESTKSGVKEKCAPFDAFLSRSKTGEQQARVSKEMWDRLKDFYDKSKSKQEKCLQCLATTTANDLRDNYGNKATNEEVLAAFGEKTYEEFLAKVLVPDACFDDPANQIDWVPTGTITIWPETEKEKSTDAGLKKIAQNIKEDKIMGLQGLCLDNSFDGIHCQKSHGVVINDFCEKMCDPNNPSDCKKNTVKILNNWGQTWQDENNDGWVDGEILVDHTNFKAHEKPVLVWIEPVKQSL
jgi:hypothetical protein